MIVLYKGRRGSGKTLTMVKDGIRFFNKGWKVFSNIHVSYAKKVDSDYILNLDTHSSLNDVVLIIDEIEVYFDSRSWNKEKQKKFTHFLQQIRKRNIVILCTCQFTNLVDVRIRQQIDVLACPSFDKYSLLCPVIYYDVTSLESSVDVISFNTHYKVNNYFHLYDTFEMVS